METGHAVVENFKRAFIYSSISMRDFTESKYFLLTVCFFFNDCDSASFGSRLMQSWILRPRNEDDLASADIPFSLSGVWQTCNCSHFNSHGLRGV